MRGAGTEGDGSEEGSCKEDRCEKDGDEEGWIGREGSARKSEEDDPEKDDGAEADDGGEGRRSTGCRGGEGGFEEAGREVDGHEGRGTAKERAEGCTRPEADEASQGLIRDQKNCTIRRKGRDL